MSRLTGTRITVLDPRYSPSGGMLKKDLTSLLCPGTYTETDPDTQAEVSYVVWENCGYTDADAGLLDDLVAPYPEDIRDPSVYFVTYETGDNTVVTVETGTIPMDMYYAKGFAWGDDYDQQDVCDPEQTDLEDWYPNAKCDDGEPELRWDWLEHGPDLATEASVYGNPSGDRFYAVWNQELPTGEVDDHGEEVYTDMDTEYRRILAIWDVCTVASLVQSGSLFPLRRTLSLSFSTIL